MSVGALARTRVLELSHGLSGAFCTKMLSDFGAQVLKVEPPSGEPSRHQGPFAGDLPDPGSGALFLHLNTGKQSVTLNLEVASGRALFLRLLAETDVVVESYPPGALDRLGLGRERLAEARPSLIITSISPFGQSGPYREHAGPELVLFALASRMYATGEPDRPPLMPYGHPSDYRAGLQAAVAILAALFAHRSGEPGQTIDVSAFESMAPVVGNAIAYRRHEARPRAGSRTSWEDPRSRYPSTVLACKDGYVHVHGHPTDRAGLAKFVGDPRLLEPQLIEKPRGNADAIDAILLPWLATQTREELLHSTQAAGLPFTKVLEVNELLTDPQNVSREVFVTVEHPQAGAVRHPAAPFRSSEAVARIGPAPRLGQDNEAVYCGQLGLSRADLARLRERGVL